jgi:molybdate transport repressor ModE-like protein
MAHSDNLYSADMLKNADELQKRCLARSSCTGCGCYVVGETDNLGLCSVLEPRYWKLPKQPTDRVDEDTVRWPDIQVELVVSKGSPSSPRRGRQREHAIFDAKLVTILEGIATYGSINKAAQNLGISYGHAFSLLTDVEQSFGFSLTNGLAGRGSTLTPEAVKLLAAYKNTAMESKETLEQSYRKEIGNTL